MLLYIFVSFINLVLRKLILKIIVIYPTYVLVSF